MPKQASTPDIDALRLAAERARAFGAALLKSAAADKFRGTALESAVCSMSSSDETKLVAYTAAGCMHLDISIGLLVVHRSMRGRDGSPPPWSLFEIQTLKYTKWTLPLTVLSPSRRLQDAMRKTCSRYMCGSRWRDIGDYWIVSDFMEMAEALRCSDFFSEFARLASLAQDVLEDQAGSVAWPTRGSWLDSKLVLPGGKCLEQLALETAVAGCPA